MKRIVLSISCLILLGLTACAPYRFLVFKPKTPEQARCLNVCQKHFEACKYTCVHNCRICKTKSNMSTDLRFMQFANQQMVQGQAVNRDTDSYKDPLNCLKISCDCVADLDACEQACTGMVRKRLISHPLPDCV